MVDASGTAAAATGVPDTGVATGAGASTVVPDAERFAARFAGAGVAASTGAGVATGAGAATGAGVATAAAFLVTFLEGAAEELMFVLVAGIEFICLKRTGYHIGG